jgi:hypothetical protein
MVLLGANPPTRFIEQHDVFFGIGDTIVDLIPDMRDFWPEPGDKLHIDSYRKVTKVKSYSINIVPRDAVVNRDIKLYFLNLGGYKAGDFEEYHYKQLVVAKDMSEAIRTGKETVFWQHHTSSHIDEKYGIDVDDIYQVEDMLPAKLKAKYALQIEPVIENISEDKLEIGYLKLSKLEKK